MATSNKVAIFIIFIWFANLYPCLSWSQCSPMDPVNETRVDERDIDPMQFAENIEFMEAEWFLWGGLGYGLDVYSPNLTRGGPPPIGVQKANLDYLTRKIVIEFGYQEVGHLRVLRDTFGLIKRPLIDLSVRNWARVFDEAFGYNLNPPFNPYRDSLNYMMASYALPYLGVLGYTGANSHLYGYWSKRVLAGLHGIESGQDAVIRMYLYERAKTIVYPYNFTVGEYTIRMSMLRNRLSMCGIKDEGVFVPRELGAENRTCSNVLSANYYSITYRRTPREILRFVYLSGNESIPGGYLPKGGNGRIARELLENYPYENFY